MINLLQSVSLTELFVIICMFALALKEFISVLEFFWGKIKSIFVKEQKEEDRIKVLQDKIEKLEEFEHSHINFTKEIKEDYNSGIQKLESQLTKQQTILEQLIEADKDFEKLNVQLEEQQAKLKQLIESDKDDIKGWIVQQYHYFRGKGSIDDFSKDTIEKRATHYFEEGGNSYIEGLIDEIRKLPPTR